MTPPFPWKSAERFHNREMSEIQGVKFFSGRRVSCRLFVDTIAFMKDKISGITFYQQGSTEFLSESQKQPTVLSFLFNDTHREKLCHTQFSPRIYWNRSLALLTFFTITQLIEFYKFHCYILKSIRFKKVIHQIDRKWKVAPFSNFCGKIWVGFCLNIGKPFFLEILF